jgi:hypothetical protein
MAQPCEYGSETAGSVKSGDFLNYPRNYWPVRRTLLHGGSFIQTRGDLE